MNTKDLIRVGVPAGEPIQLAHEFIRNFIAQGHDGAQLEAEIFHIVANPPAYFADALRAPLARAIYRPGFTPRAELAPWRQWGEGLEAEAVKQMANACALPVAVAGALMPDAHVGYGLPIGGVLATDNAVIPYAVGVDIACRMKLTVYDRKGNTIGGQRDRLANIIEDETRFGMGCSFKQRREHDVMDEDWAVSPVTERLRDKAWSQLGTSGSGNHFVEFGAFTADAAQAQALGIEPGEYLALLSHSGSRGTGAQVCDFYSKRAMARHEHLPKELKHLAWLSLDDADGQEYWAAMNLMGRYAAANHALIHKHIAKKLGAHMILDIENHHNFAWKERHFVPQAGQPAGEDREVIVHRKGATPAGAGVLGIIPGSMATPGYVVRGKGSPESLQSASHGAGRVMSRTKALQSFTWSAVKKQLAAAGVELLSAGLDEVPGVYKDIAQVMAAQTDLVDVLGRFDPKLVKMCPAGERAEDGTIDYFIHMNTILNRPTVLVLNRHWQAIHVKTPAEAFCMMASDAATALDISDGNFLPTKWSAWIALPVREHDLAVRTARGPVRVPTVIVAANYTRVPMRRPRFGARGIWERDGGVCQYTGRKLAPKEGNIDHVVPRSRGGKTSWENCVLAHREVNSRKANRLPQEAGLRLRTRPSVPRALPVSVLIRNQHDVADWNHFLRST